MYQVSLFASAVRPPIWDSLFKSLEGTSVEYEVVFAGDHYSFTNDYTYDSSRHLRYYKTGPIKPSQCYEIARRNCTGETVMWIADDAEFPNDVVGKAYSYWKSQNNEKLILSIQTKESGYNNPSGSLFNMNEHRFFSWVPDSPLMAPIALMSRDYLNKLGGLDRRYVCGQYENDIVMRAYADGAKVEIFGGEDCYVDIDHLGKSIKLGESTDQESFLKRPFATGYQMDRQVLENSWTTYDEREMFKKLERGERPLTLREISPVQLDKFEPYDDTDILTKSQSNKGKWE